MKTDQQIQGVISPVQHINKLLTQVREYAPSRLVFVGLGNRDRGDDGAGLVLLERLSRLPALKGALFISAGRTPENHITAMLAPSPECVIFIDAVRWGGTPGEFAWIDSAAAANGGFSTHTYSMHILESYLTRQFPVEVRYLGIQPDVTGFASQLSSQLRSGFARFFQ